jgi:hypothetical protein
MKKIFTGIIALFTIIAIITACGTMGAATTNSATPSGPNLDTVIEDAALQMEETIPEGTTVALVSVASSSSQLSNYILGRLEAAIVSGRRLVVVDRANLDRVREEQGFQYSGEVDDESAKEIGALLGAGAIVTGSFTDLGDVFSLSLKAINMDTATVAVSLMEDVGRSSRIDTLLASGGGAGGTATASSAGKTGTTQAAAKSAEPEAPLVKDTYSIGETGPAGGIIFYDKGNNDSGWRYLEVAPRSADQETIGNPDNTREDARGIRDRRLGAGKENTAILMEVFEIKGGGINTSAWYCDTLKLNGFDDWYLPSLDELLMLYVNIAKNGSGGFRTTFYRSSTFDSSGGVLGVDFSSGSEGNTYGGEQRVRPIRRF